jgi:hypothetical protein
VGERKKKRMEQSYRKNDAQQRVVKIAAAIDKLSQVVAVNCDFQKASDQVVAKTPFAWFFKAAA